LLDANARMTGGFGVFPEPTFRVARQN